MTIRLPCGSCLVALAIALGASDTFAAEPASGPGVTWEDTIEMGPMRGFQMPPQTHQTCRPAHPQDWKGPPSGSKDDCRVTEMKRAGSRMSWKVVCEKSRMTGEGEMNWAADTYTGTVAMHSPEQGDMTMKLRGRKLGAPCDPERERQAVDDRRREAEQRGAEMQARSAQAQKQLCDSAVQGIDFNMLQSFEPCRPRKAEACTRMETLPGWQLVSSRPESMRSQAEQACGKDLASIQQRLCAEAPRSLRPDAPPSDRDNSETLSFISRSCPAQRQALVQSECAGRSYTGKNAPAEWIRGFCVQYAQAELERGSQRPARTTEAVDKKPEKPASAKDDAVDAAKKAAKGLFGF